MAVAEADQWELQLHLDQGTEERVTVMRRAELPAPLATAAFDGDASALLMSHVEVRPEWPLSTIGVTAAPSGCDVAGPNDMVTFNTRVTTGSGWFHWNIAAPGDVLGVTFPDLGPHAALFWPVATFTSGYLDVRFAAHSALDYTALREQILLEDPIVVSGPSAGEATCTSAVEIVLGGS